MMKSIIMVVFVLCATLTLDAQSITFKEKSNTPTEQSAKTAQLSVGDTTYTVTISRTGSYKLQRTKLDGSGEYWDYLGYPTEHRYHNAVVFTDKNNTRYWYYVVGRSGYPVERDLEVEEGQ